MSTEHKSEGMLAGVGAKATLDVKVKRGSGSWSYIYTVLGFALTIETGIVGLISPLKWPYNFFALAIAGAITTYLFLDNGWFQNKLMSLKARFEEKER